MNTKAAGAVAKDALRQGAPAEPESLSLAAEFPTPERDVWIDLVDAVVRKSGRIDANAAAGAGVEQLTWTTPDGIRVAPLFTAEDAPAVEVGVPGDAPFVRGSRASGPVPDGWDVRQRHTEPDPTAAREAIAADLANGVGSIWLVVGEGGTAVEDLPTVLADVHLDLVPVVLDGGGAEELLALAADRAVEPSALLGTLGLDPLGLRARTGEGPDVVSVIPLAQRVAAEFPQVHAVVVDALPVHGAGGSDAQELGWSLAAGVTFLRVLTDAGLDVSSSARLLEFRYVATAEQFPTIAKLRAARRLWARVTEACGSAQPQFQHAVNSPVLQTRRDPYVNLLRGTLAGFAAGLGGADAVTVAPYDSALGTSTAFSRRIARNTQTLLIEEAHLARVIDPAGGSWFVEHLTEELARAAWTFFQEIEAAGGARAVLDSGWIAERTARVRERRQHDVATRRVPITGVSEFADPGERPVEPVRTADPAVGDEAGSRRRPSDNGRARRTAAAGTHAGLPVYRPAEPFEAYRDRSDARLARTGSRPRAFLATLGPLAAYTARAGFARNLLAAGGVEAVHAGPTETPEDVAKAFPDAGTPVAVLCSTDARYAECGEAVVAALRDAGAHHVLLAGKADVAGTDAALYAGCDALAVLDAVYCALDGAPEATT